MNNQPAILIRLVLTAISTGLVFLATAAFSVYLPLTRGFFNIGETMIYTIALLLGPRIACFSGGVGASMADIFLSYYYFAPATLVIKACEGGIVGLIGHNHPALSPKAWRIFTFTVGLAIGIILATVGALYFEGQLRLFWYLFGAAAVLVVSLAGFILSPRVGWPIFAMLIGGSIMIVGYYVYEKFLLFPLFGIAQIAEPEIPINIGQMVIGLAIALPIVRFVGPNLPQLTHISTRRSKVAQQ